MDGFDLVAIATLGQTVVLTVTLIVFILQLRSQTKAIKDAAYQDVLDDYNDIIRTQDNRPEIGELLDDVESGGRSSEQTEPGVTRSQTRSQISGRLTCVRVVSLYSCKTHW